ncbi:MAG: UDP-N-acetylmuramoyl-L-alanine--D-glutamate ligase [candidate division Zixibacteria bacterium]|nr:UDP-N-acetylmuramoyl-L-alanine--D-glutamate ligase [candidate division Zixibacteria bacterium]
MTVEERIKGRKIGIIGMARSGLAAALLAKRFGGAPLVSDSARAELVAPQTETLRQEGIPYETGGHTEQLLGSDYLIISPGVPPNIDIVVKARAEGLPIFSELEFASWVCRGKIIAVTGSNGKTTTTTLIGEIFKEAGFETWVCGNIGRPFAEIADKVTESGVAVVEVSTFQLEAIEDFRPHIAAILNLTPDHIDRHGSFEAYKQMKYRITENQAAEDFLILNHDDPEISAAKISTRAKILSFSIKPPNSANTFVKDDSLFSNYKNRQIKIMKVTEINIPGRHNLQNAATAALTAVLFDISSEVMRKVLKEFPGVEHRLENTGTVAGVYFINDSKATNVDSVCVALQSMTRPVYLILGGRDKGAGYEPIIEVGRDRIKGILAIGEAREKIFNALGQSFPTQFADSLEEAVHRCFELALPGETVLLSPGCASFDMFENFEHRGKVFKAVVDSLRKNKKKDETLSN